ncbi:hypothetical protein CEP52_006887 [Fusarium oligoseptatum]|uniref:Transcription factor domain-containing protein n=1 Tax=Fusarium oligoseptatum TaxID=2604345 RepID=A0A428TQM1_9HYPO|nr:hypothetical protein CEP52_006887 [Fusarium oligoseptatum]
MYAHVSDGSVLTGPPLVIVEAMVEPYFAMAKSLHSRAVSSRTSIEASGASSIDMDLIRSFIANAKRALFLSLCLVAQTSLSEDVAALVFSFAVHVAKSIGLRHWTSANSAERTNTEEYQEKQQVMYCMTCLSRAVAWSSGLSFDLPSVDLLERSLSTSSTTSHLATRVSLLQLEEQVYGDLYSDEATSQGPNAIGKTALGQGRKTGCLGRKPPGGTGRRSIFGHSER